jgi:hypothetical protein
MRVLLQGFSRNAKEDTVLVKTTSVLLIGVLLATSPSTLFAEEAAQQNVPEMRRVANAAVEKSKQVNVVLRAKRGGKKKVSGTPSQVSEQGFSLTDANSGQVSKLNFDDIREIRMKPSHVWLFVAVGVAVGLAIAVLVGLQAAANGS